METEESIVYQLLIETSGGKINDDEPIGERAIRAFMREQRAELIRVASSNGTLTEGPEFQELGLKTLENGFDGFNFSLPPMIQLPGYGGVKITSASGNVIPLMSRSSFMNSMKNIVTGHTPKAYILGQNVYVHQGIKGDSYMGAGDQLSNFVDEIAVDKTVFVEAVLFNPDDAPNYDWTKSPYPLSAELISKLKNQVKRRNISIILKTPEDEVANKKSDDVRYHDQGKVD